MMLIEQYARYAQGQVSTNLYLVYYSMAERPRILIQDRHAHAHTLATAGF
jgi:hypothetical protein